MSLRKTKVDGCWKEIDLRGMKLIFQRQQSADATVSEAFSSELSSGQGEEGNVALKEDRWEAEKHGR